MSTGPGDEHLERAVTAVSAEGWPGVVLPRTTVLSAGSYPVVRWLPAATGQVSRGQRPEVTMSTLSGLNSWPVDGRAGPLPSPLRIVGFVSVASWRHGFCGLRSLCGFGAGLFLTARRPSVWQLIQADVAGVWVTQISQDNQPAVLVRGRTGPVAPARSVPAACHLEEALFAHAVKHGITPYPLGDQQSAPDGLSCAIPVSTNRQER